MKFYVTWFTGVYLHLSVRYMKLLKKSDGTHNIRHALRGWWEQMLNLVKTEELEK